MGDLTPAVALMNEKQAAAYLGLAVRTLQKFRVYGGGPTFRKLGRSVRYLPADLAEWVELGRRTSTSDQGHSQVV